MKTKKLNIRMLALVSMFFWVANGYSQDPNFYIFLCFGQSNMEGQGAIETQDKTVDSRFRVMEAINCSGLSRTKGSWYTAVPPLARCGTGLCPVDNFGKTMVANLPANIKIGVINVSVAGCKIELFDKATYASYAAGEAAWMKNIIAEYGGNPYGRLVELAKLAQKDGVIKGILLHQGESNTGDANWAKKVNTVYTNLLADLSLKAADVPLLAGQVVDAAQGGACAGMNSTIDALPRTIPTAHVISSSGCTDASDNLHFTSAGYRLLGQRYATMMLSLLPKNGAAPTVTLTAPLASATFSAPATVALSATAGDTDGSVAKVEFYNGQTLLGTATKSPYTFSWANVAAGKYTITAIATDNAGNQTTSDAVSVRVTGATVSGTITINAKGVVGDEVINLEIDGKVVKEWTLTTAYADYTATGNVNGAIRVNYTNDDQDKRDVQVNLITVAGKTYQAEDQVINTGLYANGKCGGGSKSEMMQCSGYIEFVTDPVAVTDNCPNDPNKLEPGICGCGVAEGACQVMKVQLKAGWNVIGCPLPGSTSLPVALASIWSQVDVVKNLDSSYTLFNNPALNTLSELKWGEGYMLQVKTACTLEWVIK